MQPIEVVVQFENPTVIKSQPFPDSIPTLHGRIEWTDPSLIAMNELAVDVNDQIAISFVESLKHVCECGLRGIPRILVGQMLRLPITEMAGDAPALTIYFSCSRAAGRPAAR